MNYRLRSSSVEGRERSSRHRKMWVAIAVLVGIVVLHTLWGRQVLTALAVPVWQSQHTLGGWWAENIVVLKSKQALIRENLRLMDELNDVRVNIFMNQVLKKENEDLKMLLGKRPENIKSVIAAVLVRPPKTPYDVLVIDAGSVDGVMVGDVVLADGTVYIGEVTEVLPHSAKVEMYSSPDKKSSVMIGADGVEAEAIGQGGGNFEVRLPREVEVANGDIIVMPSVTSNIFGSVSQIEVRDKDSFQKILFKNPLNISDLLWVEVIIK